MRTTRSKKSEVEIEKEVELQKNSSKRSIRKQASHKGIDDEEINGKA